MILTGPEIQREWANGRITIEPFTPEQVNPNSYNFRLGRTLRVYRNFPLDPRSENDCDEIDIPDEGYVLKPRRLYLAHTCEVLGSDHYAPTFAARSSIARLGMFINLSAPLGDIGFKGQWTLQLYALNPVRVYPEINIGQMMWWLPRGEIVRYDGKYQGSSGPRSSDIHIDFEKQLARQRFPALGASADAAEVGPKFAALSAASSDFSVPRAFCVPAGEFSDAMSAEQRAALEHAFSDLRATVGAFYAESVEHIAELGAAVRTGEELAPLVEARVREVFGEEPAGGFAVRSSGLEEDGAASSLAGVHHSLLRVRGLDGLVAAIEQCWASYYQAPAVTARVRGGDLSPAPRLAVIIQEMIAPDLAGVAFAEHIDDRVRIEYVEGLADELVAGVAAATCVDAGSLPAVGEPHSAVLREVAALARALREARGLDVDVEWAADARGVHLLQARPVTASVEGRRTSAAPVGETCRLYFDDVPADFHLGETAAVYGSYVAKRASAYRMAHDYGVATGSGWVLQFNGRGLHDEGTATTLRAVLEAGSSGECVLDLGNTLRQIVVAKTDVLPRLDELIAGGPEREELHAAVVRDFIRGQLGVISRLAGRGLAVEYTPEGLMALNRGTAAGHTIVVSDLGRPLDEPGNVVADEAAAALLAHLPELGRFTTAMQAEHGAVTLEWVLSDGRLYFVDYSVLGSDEVTVSSSGALLISPGTASGPLLHLREDELLSRLSIGPAVSIDKSTDVIEHAGLARILDDVRAMPEPPIVHARRPYAVLSVLIGHVAGFVFDQGSTLGHLAILLREAGVPAVAAPDITSESRVVISDGTITLTGRG